MSLVALPDAAVLHVNRTWDGRLLSHEVRTRLEVRLERERLHVFVDAPLAGDPAPPPPAGSLEGLWEFEVVEVFLACPRAQHYLELELGPHGHFLALELEAPRTRASAGRQLALARDVAFHAAAGETRWTGTASVAWPEFLDRRDVAINGFRIAGRGEQRVFAAAVALPGKQVDFHQPHRFPRIAL